MTESCLRLFMVFTPIALVLGLGFGVGAAGEKKGQSGDLDLSNTHLLAVSPTFQINPSLREGFDENAADDLRFVRHNLFGKDYDIYENANISVIVTDACCASCGFCTQEIKFDGHEYGETALPRRRLMRGIDTSALYLQRLDMVLGELTRARPQFDPSVSITGGEPTLAKHFPQVLALLKKHNIRKTVLTTNGNWLMKEVEGTGKTILQHIIDAGIKHINISRAHYDENENNRIMKWKGKSLSNPELAKSIVYAQNHGVKIRLNLILSKEGISTLEQIENYMKWAASLGVNYVFVRELIINDPEASKVLDNPVLRYTEQNEVRLEELWAAMDMDHTKFRPVHQNRGYYYYVEAYEYMGSFANQRFATRLGFDRTDIGVHERTKALGRRPGIAPEVFELIWHPNFGGALSTSWKTNNKEEMILDFVPPSCYDLLRSSGEVRQAQPIPQKTLSSPPTTGVQLQH